LVEIKYLLIATDLCHFNGPSEIEKKFHGVKMMECWNVGRNGGNKPF